MSIFTQLRGVWPAMALRNRAPVAAVAGLFAILLLGTSASDAADGNWRKWRDNSKYSWSPPSPKVPTNSKPQNKKVDDDDDDKPATKNEPKTTDRSKKDDDDDQPKSKGKRSDNDGDAGTDSAIPPTVADLLKRVFGPS